MCEPMDVSAVKEELSENLVGFGILGMESVVNSRIAN